MHTHIQYHQDFVEIHVWLCVRYQWLICVHEPSVTLTDVYVYMYMYAPYICIVI